MKHRLLALIGALFALSTAAASAAPAIESTPAPKPKKPDFSTMSFFVGTWTCTTTSANRPGPSTSSTTWTMDDTGYWMTGKGTAAAVKWFPYETKSDVRMTYDSDAKLWIFLDSDNLGGYGMYTTPGWNGGKAVWTARSFFPTKDMKAVSNYTMTKLSDSKYDGVYSFTNAKGTVVGGKDVCTKS